MCRWRTPISAAWPGLLTCVSRALIPHPEPIRTRESSPVIEEALVEDAIEITALRWRNESERFTRDDGEPLSDHAPIAVAFSVTSTS